MLPRDGDGSIHVAAPIISAHPLFIIAAAPATGLKPTTLQSIAMLGTVAGVAIVAAGGTPASGLATNAASAACALVSNIAYAAAVVAAQRAVPLNGDFAAIRIGRLSRVIALGASFIARREPLRLPKAWRPFFCAQGQLGTGSLMFFAVREQ